MKQNARHQVYIPPRQRQWLRRLASRPGASKTPVPTAAFELLFGHARPANLPCVLGASPKESSTVSSRHHWSTSRTRPLGRQWTVDAGDAR